MTSYMIALGMLCFSFCLTEAKNTETFKHIGTLLISICLTINQERIICHNPLTYIKQILVHIILTKSLTQARKEFSFYS